MSPVNTPLMMTVAQQFKKTSYVVKILTFTFSITVTNIHMLMKAEAHCLSLYYKLIVTERYLI